MEIKILQNKTNGENTYIITENKRSAVIDPGLDFNEILKNAENIEYILLTHCHFDHIEALIDLKEKTDAKIVFSEVNNLNDENINLSTMIYGKNIGTEPDILVSDGDVLDFLNIKCIKTPGHTSCGMCYLLEDNLFSGDTLFSKSVGRWDLPTGSFKILKNTILEKLYTLPDNTKVYPGHGESTTIGEEKKFNSVIRIWFYFKTVMIVMIK